MSYVRDGSSLLVPGGGTWWKNLGDGRPGQVCVRGSWTPVDPELVTDPVAMEDLMRRMLAANPTMGLFTGIRLGPDGRPDAAALDRERRRGFIIVRLRLASGVENVATSSRAREAS
jgi:hypothetical protein